MPRINSKWTLTSRSTGDFKENDYTMVEGDELPPLGPDEICVKVVMVSCDPTQIGWSRMDTYIPKVPLGEVMRAPGVGLVEESNSAAFEVGDLVCGMTGFQKYWQGKPSGGQMPFSKLPKTITPGSAMCIYSHIGLTAHRLISIGEPKEGETVIVTGGAGAVGVLVCQLAKALGCRVVATAGSEEKLAFLRDEIGVDAAINYKQDNLREALKEACPKGVDIYWENVGGKTTEAAWPLLNFFGRVICCGMISAYTATDSVGLPLYNTDIIIKQLKIQGFICTAEPETHGKIMETLTAFAIKGQITPKVDVVHGFENTISALAGIYRGDNIGKRVVQYAEAPEPSAGQISGL